MVHYQSASPLLFTDHSQKACQQPAIPNANGSTEYRTRLTLAFQNGVKGLNSGFRGNGSQTTGFYGDAELFAASYPWDN